MARQKIHQHHIRNLQRSNGMYYVSIPVEIVRKFGWKERHKLEVHQFGRKRIIVSDLNQ